MPESKPVDYAAVAAQARELSDAEIATALPTNGHVQTQVTVFQTVQRRPVQWVWKGRIAFGKMAVIEGDPGLGKSLVAADLGARVTRGWPMPGETEPTYGAPHGVLFLASEDALDDTLVPRFALAGGDLNRAARLDGMLDPRTGLLLPPTLDQLAAIEQALDQVDAGGLIVDPLAGHLPSATNSWRDEQMRAVLAPLADLVNRRRKWLIAIRHYTKDSDRSALYRGAGSIAITATARTVLAVLRDPTVPERERYILAPVKASVARKPAAWTYEIVADHGDEHPHIRWGQPLSTPIDELLQMAQQQGKQSSQVSQCARALADLLAAADAGLTKPEIDEVLDGQGFSHATVQRARDSLGPRITIRAIVVDDTRAYRWLLDEKAAQAKP